ncbi:hypothetical protein CLV59_111162 [Chitinophaga dinghuensis]|uniref:Uncharacterized protein n=1 Tax=Chitinophaga dinghuensis TaxID=1539050 RepID=A0A327VU17_9BACT|nr:hypothetical protein CLV59_111162 [Chitinophaga dinghuensis]
MVVRRFLRGNNFYVTEGNLVTVKPILFPHGIYQKCHAKLQNPHIFSSNIYISGKKVVFAVNVK